MGVSGGVYMRRGFTEGFAVSGTLGTGNYETAGTDKQQYNNAGLSLSMHTLLQFNR